MNKRYYSEYWLAVCPNHSPYIKADITAISTYASNHIRLVTIRVTDIIVFKLSFMLNYGTNTK